MKQGTLIIALGLAAALTTTAAAGAASSNDSAHASALNLGITGGPDADEISIALDATQTQFVMTSARPINPPSPPCTQISTFQISCPTSGFVSFSASLGRGNDRFTVGPSISVPVTANGGPGRDFVRGGSGTDTLLGGEGGDRLVGNNGRDALKGGKGGDELVGGKGGDSLRGGPGRDVETQ